MSEDDCHPRFRIPRWKLYPNFWRLHQRDLCDLLQRGKEYHDRRAISQAQSYAMHCKLEKQVSPPFDNLSRNGFVLLSEPNNQLLASVTSTKAANSTTKSKKSDVLRVIFYKKSEQEMGELRKAFLEWVCEWRVAGAGLFQGGDKNENLVTQ